MADRPIDILMSEFMPEAIVAAVEAEVARIEELPVVKTLGDLKTPVYGRDPSELIGRRFLYRGGVLLVLGPTGIGKSSFVIQLGIHLAVGKPLFGIVPGEVYRLNGMRVLLIQAENDEGDLAEMRDGVLAGCKELRAAEKRQALEQFKGCTINDRSAERFAEALGALLERQGPFDVVIVDPAFAYLGGDSNSQRDVSYFMRELLNPLLQKHGVGMILAHHTNKPLRGKEKENWEAGDYAYLGAGSAEWINPARAALAIRSLGSDSVFELRAPKRGKRLRWEDEDGRPTVKRYIAHHGDPGVICWRDATFDEIEEVLSKSKKGRPRKCDPMEVLHCIKARPQKNQGYYKATISKVLGCSETSVQNALRSGMDRGLIRFVDSGREKLYLLSPKGEAKAKKRPSAHRWGD